MRRTFVDSGVLIAAAIGAPQVSVAAREVLDDPDREFVSSDFVRLEVLPKAIYYQQETEAAFYQTFFGAVSIWVPASQSLAGMAFEEARRFGLSALDGLHVAAG